MTASHFATPDLSQLPPGTWRAALLERTGATAHTLVARTVSRGAMRTGEAMTLVNRQYRHEIGPMGYSLLREQPTERLRDVNISVENLLTHSEILPTELRIKLETLRADVTSILEDRQDWGDTRPES